MSNGLSLKARRRVNLLKFASYSRPHKAGAQSKPIVRRSKYKFRDGKPLFAQQHPSREELRYAKRSAKKSAQ